MGKDGGGMQTAGIYKDGGPRVDKSAGDYRRRPGWVMTAGGG